jgi:hypothetical protein
VVARAAEYRAAGGAQSAASRPLSAVEKSSTSKQMGHGCSSVAVFVSADFSNGEVDGEAAFGGAQTCLWPLGRRVGYMGSE